jgi:ATP-binding protein involved in chromosome partitioning
VEAGEQQILAALGRVVDPELGRDIVSLGFVKGLTIADGKVSFTLELTTPACPLRDVLKYEAEKAVLSVPGVKEVEVQISANTARFAGLQRQRAIAGVSHVIAVASGKGGVGKSTISVNLAVALAMLGAKVGLLDADVYGPSIPKMMGLTEQPGAREGRVIPLERFGVKVMSLGLVVRDAALIWRGPLLARAVEQMLRDVDWGELDYLIVDLPPGTGDVPLTLSQSVPVSGVVIVATPQQVALQVAAKAAAMFSKMGVPILGVVDNMNMFICPHCGKQSKIFDAGAGDIEQMGLDLLGSVPLDGTIVKDGDEGTPTVWAHPESPQAAAFRFLAQAVAARMSVVSASAHSATA